MRRRGVWVIAVVGLTVAAVACGGDEAPEAPDETAPSSTEVETQSEEQALEADASEPAEAPTARVEPEQQPERRVSAGVESEPTEPERDTAPEGSTPASDEASEEAAARPESGAGTAPPESNQAEAAAQDSAEATAQGEPGAGGAGDGDRGGATRDITPLCGQESEDPAETDSGTAEPAEGAPDGAASQPEPDPSAHGSERDPAEAAFEFDLPDWLAAATEARVQRPSKDSCTRLLMQAFCTHCGSSGPVLQWWSRGRVREGTAFSSVFFHGVSDFRWGRDGQAVLECGYCVAHGESVFRPPNFYWSTDGGLTWGRLPLPEPGKWIWSLEWMESPTRWVASREPAVVEGRLIRPTGGPLEFVLLPDLTVLGEQPTPPEPPAAREIDAHGQRWTRAGEDPASWPSRLLRDGALVRDFAPFGISTDLSLSPSGERLVFSLNCAAPSDSCERLFPNDAWVVVLETGTGSSTILRVPLEEFRPDIAWLESDPPESPGLGAYWWQGEELLWGVVHWRSLATLRPVALRLETLSIDVYAEPGAAFGHHYPIATMTDRTHVALTSRG